MSNIPLLTSSQNQMELLVESPDMPTSTSTSDTSILDDVTFPILSNCDDLTSSKASHIDENNENEAVRNNLN